MTDKSTEKWSSIEEVADLIGVSKDTLPIVTPIGLF